MIASETGCALRDIMNDRIWCKAPSRVFLVHGTLRLSVLRIRVNVRFLRFSGSGINLAFNLFGISYN